MLIKMARADRDDFRFRFRKHLPEVSKARRFPNLLPRRFESHRISIGDSHDLRFGHSKPHGVKSMPVISAPRVANHSDSPSFPLGKRAIGNSTIQGCESGRGKKIATIHPAMRVSRDACCLPRLP
jgi:hypothetical protein